MGDQVESVEDMENQKQEWNIRSPRWLMMFAFLVWAALFSRFYRGELTITADALEYFDRIKYYLDNFVRGVYPLWNPFEVWGRPDELNLRFFGEFNPFLGLIAVLHQTGLPFSLAYWIYGVLYFFLGCAGFYLLARRVLEDQAAAVFAFLILLFSGLGATWFNSPAIVYLFVCIVWFFYFFVAFSQTPHRALFIGMVYSLMIISVTYIPFYFLTIFLLFLIFFSALYPHKIPVYLKRYGRFVMNHQGLVVLSIVVIGFSLLPGYFWYQEGGRGEMLIAWRHAGSETNNVNSMAMETITKGGVVGNYSLYGLIANIEDILPGALYVPLFTFCVMLVCLWVKVNRRMILLYMVGFTVFLISLTDSTPVYQFLFNHVFYFRYFRNLQFLLWLCLPFLILVVAEQLRLFNHALTQGGRKKGWLIVFVLLCHIGFFVFLTYQENVIGLSYAVVALSLLFFTLQLTGFVKVKTWIYLYAVFFLVILHPVEAFRYAGDNVKDSIIMYQNERFKPVFNFIRPPKELSHKREALMRDRIIMNPADRSGLENAEGVHRYIGLERSFFLHQRIPHDILQDYVRYKFILYDHVQPVADDNAGIILFGKAILQHTNLALISTESYHGKLNSEGPAPYFQPVLENTDAFQVVDFDINEITIKTNFPTWKFLVYNDSYHSQWNAKINGKKADIYRANVAFKGLWIPPGPVTLHLKFGSATRHFLNLFLWILFHAGLIYLILSLSRYGKERSPCK